MSRSVIVVGDGMKRKTKVAINYAMAWHDLKDLIERGEMTDKESGTLYASDLLMAMDELELDARA